MKEYTRPDLNVILFQAESVCYGGFESGEEVPVIPEDDD